MLRLFLLGESRWKQQSEYCVAEPAFIVGSIVVFKRGQWDGEGNGEGQEAKLC
jgi:hypothetical protein